MKDLVTSAKTEVSEQKGQDVTQRRVWIKSEAARVGLAETLSTYVMMVRNPAVVSYCMYRIFSQCCLTEKTSRV